MASKTTNGRPRSSTTYSLQGSSNTLSIWSRIKSGRSEFFEKDYHHTRRKETSSVEICGYPSADREQRPQVSEDRGDRVKSATPKDDQPGSTALLDQDAQNCSEDTINSIELVDSTYCNSNTSYDEDDSYTWQDPVSKEIIRINSRTGQALLQVPFQSEPKTVLGSCTTDSLREQLKSNFRLKKSTNVEIKTGQSIQSLNWVDMFLEEWDNPVFAPTEQPISQASKFSSLGEDSTKDLVNCCSHSSIDELSSSTSATRLSKLSMKTAEVISQLDRKFILVKMNQEIGPPSISSLVLVDQHAADERCRVEDLLSALCEPVMSSTSCQSNSTCPIQTFPFDKPLNLQITCQEAKLFEIYAQHFKTWGIIYDLNNELSNFKGKKSKQDIRLVVRSVPPGIVERCKTEPKRLLELLRAEIWKSHDHSGQSRFTSKTDLGGKGGLSTHSWLERIGSCPQGILDMLISRSCRSRSLSFLSER
jgi:DNA mismatch repair protein MLH3